MADNNFLQKLSQNLLEILDDDEYCDITIEVGNDPYVKIFRAHMVILNYRSAYLRRILSTNKNKNDGTLVQIKLPNILPENFQIILRYIYGGKLSLEEYDTLDIIKILVAANKLSLQELVDYLQSSLIKNRANWIEQNFNLVYQTSFENDSFLELQKYCTNLVSNDPDKIFNSPNFSSIPEKILITIIQSENLQIDDVQVWKNVLKWGSAQNPELPSDPTKFSKNDFNILKNTIQQCIPFIKFYNLTCKEFLDNVFPYREVLPEELYADLVKSVLGLHPDSKLNDKSKPEINSKSIDSKIITYQHAELISKWVDKLDITDELTSSYEFKLLFRGSRDGFTPKKFYEICKNQSHTITIIKVKDSNEILGGYNPIEWKYDNLAYNKGYLTELGSYGNTKDSFIFSFKINNSIENYVLSRVIEETYAIYYYSCHGPSFGSDLTTCGNNFKNDKENYCIKGSYEKPIRKTKEKFSIEEYEVYQIKKN